MLRIRMSRAKAEASTSQTRWHLASGNKTSNRRHFGHVKRGNSQSPPGKESDFCAWGQGSVKMGWVWSLDYRNCFL